MSTDGTSIASTSSMISPFLTSSTATTAPKLTINNNNRMSQQNNVDDNDDNDANEDYHYHGPLVKVCRDCKILVRHLIDIGHTNFNGANFQK